MSEEIMPTCLLGVAAPWGQLYRPLATEPPLSEVGARTAAIDTCDRMLTALAALPHVQERELPAWLEDHSWHFEQVFTRFEDVKLAVFVAKFRAIEPTFDEALAKLYMISFLRGHAASIFGSASDWLHTHLPIHPDATTFAALRAVVEKHVGDRTWKVQHLITTLHRFDHANTLPWLCTLATSPQLSPDVLRAVAYKLAAEKTRPDLVAQGAAILAALPSDEDDSDEDA